MSGPRQPAPPRPTRIVIATRNPGKLEEFRSALEGIPGPPVELLGLDRFPLAPDVEETGDTYRDNARLKAESALRATGIASLGDDSGLEIDALHGAPGLRSARYAGPGADAKTLWRKVLDLLAEVPDERRTARFRCVLALVEPGSLPQVGTGIVFSPDDPMRSLEAPIPLSLTFIEGVVEGVITREPRGSGGFGYDPIFEIAGNGRTMAEIPATEKNRLSHRGRALARLKEILTIRS